MRISCNSVKKGIDFSIEDKAFSLEYPEGIWEKYPDNLKKVFVDNFAFLKAMHLPQMLNKKEKVEFNTSYPLFKKQLTDCMLNNIPFCADVDGVSTEEKLKSFINQEFDFKDYRVAYPSYENILDEKAVLTMSFGKDSLLSYGLAEELGLKPSPVFMVDNSTVRENMYKKVVSEKFSKEFNRKVWSFENGTGVIHDYRYWKLPRTEWGYGHLITEFFLDLMPFSHNEKAKYVLLANEKSCDDVYINKDGYKSYPVFDQSSEWLVELTKMANAMTSNQAKVVSLVEPIYELAVIKILHNRYPKIGKYQMSCFPDENDYGKEHYWCEHCSKCARIFIFLKANNIDPARVGFKTNMLIKENLHLFSCFGLEKKEGFSIGYDATGMGSDEQLYAFFLVYKKGVKGELMDLFKKELLETAKEKEDEFHKRFFGIHDSKTVPEKFIKPLHSIYKEELSK